MVKNSLAHHELFTNLSESEFKKLVQLMEEKNFFPGDIIIRGGEINDHVYIILSGTVNVIIKDQLHSVNHVITELSKNDVIGEISLIDKSPRSATVQAKNKTQVLQFSLAEIHDLNHHNIYLKILENMARLLSKKIRTSNAFILTKLQKEIEHAKERISMGKLIINTIIVLCFYIFALQMTSSFRTTLISPTFISVPGFAIVCIILSVMMIKSGYSAQFYGLTFNNWRKAISESLIATLFLMIVIVLFKTLLIRYVSTFHDQPLFAFRITTHPVESWVESLILFFYLLFVPMQELVARGILQSSFYHLLAVKRKKFSAIFLSNLIFSITHVHVSIFIALMVFLPGLLWGWLYARHKTLIGVTLSHLIIGISAFFIVGIQYGVMF